MIRVLLVAAFLAPASAFAQAGNISEMIGKVHVQRDRGQTKVTATTGYAIKAGDLVETGKTGRAKLLMKDQSVISIAPKSKFKISKVSVNRKTKKRESSFFLLAGAVKSFVSSFWGNDNSYEIRSNTAVAGVRGTTFTFEVAQDGTSKVTVLEGAVEVYNPSDGKRRSVVVGKGQDTEVKKGRTPGKPRKIPKNQRDDRFVIDADEQERQRANEGDGGQLHQGDLPPADESLGQNPNGGNQDGQGDGSGQDGQGGQNGQDGQNGDIINPGDLVDIPDTTQIINQIVPETGGTTRTNIKIDF